MASKGFLGGLNPNLVLITGVIGAGAFLLFRKTGQEANQFGGGGTVFESVGSGVENVGEGIGDAFGGLGNAFLGLGTGIGNAFTGIGAGSSQTLSGAGNLATGLGTGIGTAGTGLGEGILRAGFGINQALTPVSNIVGNVTGTFNKGFDFLSTATSTTGNFFSQLFGSVNNAASALTNYRSVKEGVGKGGSRGTTGLSILEQTESEARDNSNNVRGGSSSNTRRSGSFTPPTLKNKTPIELLKRQSIPQKRSPFGF